MTEIERARIEAGALYMAQLGEDRAIVAMGLRGDTKKGQRLIAGMRAAMPVYEKILESQKR